MLLKFFLNKENFFFKQFINQFSDTYKFFNLKIKVDYKINKSTYFNNYSIK